MTWPQAPFPGWGWAVMHRARRNGTDARVFTIETTTLAITATNDPRDDHFLVAAQAMPDQEPTRASAERLLDHWGWEAVAPWQRVDPGLLPQGGPTIAGNSDGLSDAREVVRVRSKDIGTRDRTMVPYGQQLRWAFDGMDRGEAFWEDSSWQGPAPGWVVFALRLLERVVEARESDPMPPEDEARAAAWWDATVKRFNAWVCDQVRTHGWPRAGTDPRATTELLLSWVCAYADVGFRSECHQRLTRMVEAGDADPDDLATLEAALT